MFLQTLVDAAQHHANEYDQTLSIASLEEGMIEMHDDDGHITARATVKEEEPYQGRAMASLRWTDDDEEVYFEALGHTLFALLYV